jgi:hypothetical protein
VSGWEIEDHHPTYHSLINAVLEGCYICVLLWERLPQDAKRALPTFSSDYTLLKCEYFMEQNQNSQLRRVKVYTNPTLGSVLFPPGINNTTVLLEGLPTNGASSSSLSVVLCIMRMNCC